MEKEKLYEENQGLIGYFLNRTRGYIPHNEYEDVMQHLRMALWIACLKYDPKIAKFSTYAMTVLNHQFWQYHRSKRCANRKLNYGCASLQSPIQQDDEDTTIGDTIQEPTNTEDEAIINIIMSRLSDEDKKIIELYCTYETQAEIGKQLGITQRGAHHKKEVVLKKIRKELGVS